MIRFTHMPLTAIAILALTGCAASTTPAAEQAAEAVNSAPEKALPAPAEGMVRIRINGFECGDNCYLYYSRWAPAEGDEPANQSQSALCQVDACDPWFDFQDMPPEFIGRTAVATIGIGEQYDNEGNVMSDDFPKILSITLDPVE